MMKFQEKLKTERIQSLVPSVRLKNKSLGIAQEG